MKSDDVLVEESFDEFAEDPDANQDGDAAEEGPDLLLREAARIVSDVTELESNLDLLNRKFSQLNSQKQAAPKLN